MKNSLKGKKVAILVASGFEQVELTAPREALQQAGAQSLLVSPEEGEVKGWSTDHWGDTFEVDVQVADANAGEFDALLLPGGVINPDRLRRDPRAVRLVREFVDAGKPIAAICHGPVMLIEADAVRGRQMTSFHAIKTDMINAGANWVDQQVVVDEGIVSSREPDDLPAFNRKMVEEFGEGSHVRKGSTGGGAGLNMMSPAEGAPAQSQSRLS